MLIIEGLDHSRPRHLLSSFERRTINKSEKFSRSLWAFSVSPGTARPLIRKFSGTGESFRPWNESEVAEEILAGGRKFFRLPEIWPRSKAKIAVTISAPGLFHARFPDAGQQTH